MSVPMCESVLEEEAVSDVACRTRQRINQEMPACIYMCVLSHVVLFNIGD